MACVVAYCFFYFFIVNIVFHYQHRSELTTNYAMVTHAVRCAWYAVNYCTTKKTDSYIVIVELLI
jgi:hypothetical protein